MDFFLKLFFRIHFTPDDFLSVRNTFPCEVKEKTEKERKDAGSTISQMEFYEAHNRNEDGYIVPIFLFAGRRRNFSSHLFYLRVYSSNNECIVLCFPS